MVVPQTRARIITDVAENDVRTTAYTVSVRQQKALEMVVNAARSLVPKKDDPSMPLQEQSSSRDAYAATPQQITQALKLWKDRLIKS